MRPLRSMTALALVFVSGCGDKICTLLPTPVVEVDIRDSITNAPVAYGSSLIVAGVSAYDSTFVGAPFYAPGNYSTVRNSRVGTPGIYTIRVRHPGYQLWQRVDVRVDGDRCAAFTEKLLARLQPSTSMTSRQPSNAAVDQTAKLPYATRRVND